MTVIYSAVWTKNCLKSSPVSVIHWCNQSSHYKKYRWCSVPQLSSETELSIALLCQLCSTRYIAVRIKSCLKSTPVIKVAAMKDRDDFCYAKEAITCNHQIVPMLFTVSKDEWNTKEDTGKSMKNALCILLYAKRHLSGWSNIESEKSSL